MKPSSSKMSPFEWPERKIKVKRRNDRKKQSYVTGLDAICFFIFSKGQEKFDLGPIL
jgi:hypothetical protein